MDQNKKTQQVMASRAFAIMTLHMFVNHGEDSFWGGQSSSGQVNIITSEQMLRATRPNGKCYQN